ncbi:glycoside hydrolase [Phascolomyces articulosus]|uniref:alpha-1,2-Mannosidase n=1 Tax=Phascolomyces articulosus TaxID=60185 RepID=A0AAD5PJS6_9FUNG|nr:glycoside hydrolase [Phascolomyces articulosus]
MSFVVSKIPYRWRILFLGFFIAFILAQCWIIATKPVDQRQIPSSSQQPQPNNNDVDDYTSNPIYGFDNFESRLPLIQRQEFTHLPDPHRQAQVKKSFLHAWNGYMKYAKGHDELMPVSLKHKDPFGGWGATLVDGLSTLLVMELYEEFEETLPELEKINFLVDEKVSVFESTIRYLGGLLSAYELTNRKYPILLQKADELGQALLPAFDYTLNGLPPHEWNPVKNAAPGNNTLIAEIGTVQLEFLTLALHTKKKVYAEKAQIITDFIDSAGYEHGMYLPGLYPSGLRADKGRFTDATCSFGAMGDSVYEYFLKEYILTDGSMPQYAQLYTRSIDSMKHHMLRQLPGTDFLFLPPYDTRTGQAKNAMDHLTCFVPGMLAMGAQILDRPEDMMIAKGLLEMCVYMYRSSATGLCPETWHATETEKYNPLTYGRSRDEIDHSRDWWYMDGEFEPPLRQQDSSDSTWVNSVFQLSATLAPPQLPRPNGLAAGDRSYKLRPETIESIYILYRITGDPKYQEYGWEIFQSLEKYCKTEAAYSSIFNVEDIDTRKMDSLFTLQPT